MNLDTENLVGHSDGVRQKRPDPTSSQSGISADQTLKLETQEKGLREDQALVTRGSKSHLYTEENVQPGTEEDPMDSSVTEDPVLLRTTNLQSLMHLIKGNIGTGILAMPVAFKYAGLWVGFGGMIVIGVLATHCMHILVKISHHLCSITGHESLDYGAVAEQVFLVASPKMRPFAQAAENIVNIFVCIVQFGFCTVYILFVGENISQVVDSAVGGTGLLNIRLYDFFVFLLLVPFVFVRKLKHLAPFSLLANVLMAVGLVTTLQYCFRNLHAVNSYPAFSSWGKLPMFFGVGMFAIEGIGVVMPIENKMKHPEDFTGLSGVLNLAMVIVVVMFLFVGFYGYLAFGSLALGSITLNLPRDDWLYLAVKLVFSLALYLTYGLQFYVPLYIIWPPLKARLSRGRLRKHGENLLRIGFLTMTFLLAISIPHLDLMISLVGALASSAVGLIFPPILEIILLWPDGLGRYRWRLIKDILISVFGFVGFVTGTTVTLMEIIYTFQQG